MDEIGEGNSCNWFNALITVMGGAATPEIPL